ncbi:DUF4349 domain-containing protein [Thalassoroseus pseudoceratinae]|uniref:DUF4349 domain-containing protein n=1 Tax=Thalassoroseus pseudoceratinae TaxID=2713176 RepID=UPI00141FD167|nr:DUF4349 domain-containing protein [Thalassoroseus pseudoceratinae]
MKTRAIGCLIFLLVGCGASYQSDGAAKYTAAEGGEANADFDAPAGAERAAVAENNGGVDVESAERKIIYEARISLVVDDFEAASKSIQKLVERYEGYLGETSVDRTQGAYRTGRWVARIPVKKFSECLDELAEIGVAERQGQTAQDVTMEYLDVEARIKTKKELEQRILDLLADRDGKLQDVIAAEQELARVRSEIESMEGRLRYLQNRTSFSTVTIDVREEKDYVPPKAPTFSDRIATVWNRSLDSLQDAGLAVVLAAVAFVPWMIPTLLFLLVCYLVLKTVYRKVRHRFFGPADT